MTGGTGSKPRTPRTVLDPVERRGQILAAAEAAFARRGISRTTMSDVAREAGVTRGLVYHYFPEHAVLVDAVLDRQVEEFVASVRAWDAARRVGEVDRALRDVVAIFRAHLRSTDPLRVDLHRVENAALNQRFVDRAVTAVVDCLQLTTVEAYAARHAIAITHVRETFLVLVHGLVALVRAQRDVPDEVLVAIARQVLRLDVVTDPPATEPARLEES